MKSFHIETKDGAVSLNFFTTAKTHKEALRNLIENSFDFKNILKCKNDIIITVKKITNNKPTP
jgi:hypothetical protein